MVERSGERVPAPCRHCGAALPSPARYCHMCGTATDAPFDSALLPPRLLPPAPARSGQRATQTGALIVGLLTLGAGLLVGRARIAGAINPMPTPAPAPAAVAPVATPTPALPSYELLTLDVPAGGSYRLTFPAFPAGTTLEGYFRVDAEDIGFRIQQPDGHDLVNLPSVSGRYDFRYTAPEAGQYSMVFAEQSTPLSDRQLVLVYRDYVLTNS